MSTYIFDNAGEPTGQRFNSLETLYDSWTIRHLQTTGIGAGWQCWEVGGGGGASAALPGEGRGPPGAGIVTGLRPPLLVGGAALVPPPDAIPRPHIRSESPPAQQFCL